MPGVDYITICGRKFRFERSLSEWEIRYKCGRFTLDVRDESTDDDIYITCELNGPRRKGCALSDITVFGDGKTVKKAAAAVEKRLQQLARLARP